jgi:hypothetical protein
MFRGYATITLVVATIAARGDHNDPFSGGLLDELGIKVLETFGMDLGSW